MKRIRTRCFFKKVRGILCLALTLAFLLSTVSAAWGAENDDQLVETAAVETSDVLSVDEEEVPVTFPSGGEGEAEDTVVIVYDPQPGSIEEVQAVIDTYKAAYSEALASGGFFAAIAVQKPHWQYAVDNSMMPSGYNCQLVTDGADFGADYYTFFVGVAAMAAVGPNPTTAQVQSAIDGASDGDTIQFVSNVTLTTALNINKSLTFSTDGPSYTITSPHSTEDETGRHMLITGTNVTLTFSNVVLQGNTIYPADSTIVTEGTPMRSFVAGGIDSSANALTLVNAEVRGCHSYAWSNLLSGIDGSFANGTGIRARGNLTLQGCTIADNIMANTNLSAGAGGGVAVYDANGLTLSVQNCIITGNKTSMTFASTNGSTSAGGGIYFNSDNGIATVTDSTISGNIANHGGGISLKSNGALTIGNSAVLSDNIAVRGGGVCFESTSTLTLKGNAVIKNCDADQQLFVIGIGGTGGTGGGVFVSGGSIEMENATIDDNHAQMEGGGVYSINCVFNMGSNAKMKGNTAYSSTAGTGGGVFVSDGIFTMSDNAEIDGTQNTYSYNARSNGGGVAVSSGTFTMEDQSVIQNCTAGTAGGGVSAASTTSGANFYMVSSGAKIVRCSAGTYGGGVSVGTNSTFDLSAGTVGGSSADANSATLYGGGVAIMTSANSTAEFKMSGGEVSYNKSSSLGGGVWLSHSGNLTKFTMTGGEIYANSTALYGGGVYVTITGGAITQNAIFDMSGGVIGRSGSPNTATRGGGAYINAGTFKMTGGTVGSNTVSEDGGGVFVNGLSGRPAYFDISGGFVTGNTAVRHGGGVYTSLGTVTMSDSAEITYNEAANSGGGVYIAGAAWEMSGGSISSNTATLSGGGVYMSNSAGMFTMTGGAISSNVTNGAGDAQGGGGAYINAGVFDMSGGTINSNTAVISGGGVYVFGSGGYFCMSNNSDVSNNIALAGNGGGIYAAEAGSVEVVNSTISGNKALSGDGGGIYTAAANSAAGGYSNLIVVSTVTFSGNTASKAYIPLDATKAPYDSYWTTIKNKTYSLGVTVPTVSWLAAVNNYDINVSLVLVKFNTSGGDYYVNGVAGTIPDQSHAWDALVTDPESVITGSRMYLEHYKFTGWELKDGTAWDFSSNQTTLAADAADGTSDEIITLYAKWEELKGSITINKFKDDGTSELADVTFTLKDDSGNVVATATTDGGGVAAFTNLPAGKYTIMETKVPKGYSLLADSFEVTIPQDVTGTSYTGATTQTTLDGKIYGYDLTYKVTNQASFDLPEAGATGSWNPYYLWIGLALLLAGGGSAVWWMKRRGMRRAV